MWKKEWQALVKNKMLLIAMAALILIPTIYSGLFLGSMWDPYGNVDHLPVAVVNLDQSTDYQGKTLEVGKNLVDNLKENQALDFHFVSEKEAEEGLADGTYYMTMTIPEDFSKNASTVLDKKPQKMELMYETNPGTNYIASKMSETGLAKIKEAVAQEVTRTYTETMFEQIADAGSGMGEAADGAGALADGAKQLYDGNQTISENLQVLSDSTLTLKSGTETLNMGLADYVRGVESVADGAVSLKNGVGSYTEGVSQAAQGASALNDGSGALNSGVDAVSDGVSRLNDGSASLTGGLRAMSSALESTGVDQETVNALTGGLEQYRTGIHELYRGMSGFSLPDSSGIQAEAEALGANLAEAGSGAANAGSDIGAAIATLQSIGDLTEDQQTMVNSAIASLGSAGGNIAGAGDSISAAGGNAGNIGGALNGLSGAADALSSGADALAALDANADMVLGGSTQAVSGLYDGIESVRSALNTQLIPGAEALQGGIGQVQQGVDTDLKQGVAAYTAGVSDLKNGLDRIDSNSSALQSGASQLSEGTEQLTANNGTLLSGAGQIASGAGQISDGAAKLAEGSQTLGSGIFDVRKGSQTLKKGLEDGAKQVSSLSATKDTFDMFSAPVEASGTQKTYVENNGHAMAPYMMSVALWVGCIAFCILYPLNKYEGELKSGLSWYGANASVMYVIALVMALVMIGLLHVCDGFSPVEMGKTTAFAVLASIAFMSVIYFFEMCFGKIGSFMMLIFMVVQLAGSAGTYPVEISAGFVAKIHRWLPFTYTVDAFRSTISGGESIRIPVIVLTAVAIVFIGLTILVFEKRAKNIRENKKGFSDYLESKGLA